MRVFSQRVTSCTRSADGTELFYNPGPGQFAWVSVTTHPTFGFGNPHVVPRPFTTGPLSDAGRSTLRQADCSSA